MDEGFFFRDGGTEKRSLYRAIDEHGQVLDVLVRDHRDTAAAKAFFRRALTPSGVTPNTVVSDHHQPSMQAVREGFPEAVHVRTGLHGAARGCAGRTARRRSAWSAATAPPQRHPGPPSILPWAQDPGHRAALL